MKLTDDFDNDGIKSGMSMGAMLIGVLTFMAILVGVVIMVNKPNTGSTAGGGDPFLDDELEQKISENKLYEQVEEDGYPVGESTLVSDDLDFWNMYKEDKDLDKELDHTAEQYADRLEALEEETKEDDLSENGTKTEVILPDGTSQWVMINAYIEKNNYDYTGLVNEEPYMRYYTDGKKVSKQGISIDDSYGTINFARVEEAGIDYCMIQMGNRGYATGAITMEKNYAQYMKDADAAGLGVGITFYSQAATEAEAVEEANLILQMLQESEVKPGYPIVFEMELVSNGYCKGFL